MIFTQMSQLIGRCEFETVHIYMETCTEPGRPLQRYDDSNDILLFFKFFDPDFSQIKYCGHEILRMKDSLASLFPQLCNRAHLPVNTPLILELANRVELELIDKNAETTTTTTATAQQNSGAAATALNVAVVPNVDQMVASATPPPSSTISNFS
uniref:Ubiquitin carboxyl-terminal hydrolase 7 ICP0-binding domain-containing protein n=1 Tax=Romanomermis culicivorax TaxID=13658 RepID=A0A915I0C7_ROMCU